MQDLLSLLPLLAIFALFWFLMIRPAQRRQREISSLQAALAVGDQVVTSGGIVGTIARVADDTVGVEVAPGVVLDFVRPAIVGKKEA